MHRLSHWWAYGAVLLLLLVALSPALLPALGNNDDAFQAFGGIMPTTVYPDEKAIRENAQVNAFIAQRDQLHGRVAVRAQDFLMGFVIRIGNSSLYQHLTGSRERIVHLASGMRKEEVAESFGKTLSWDARDQDAFLASAEGKEGRFAPGIYFVPASAAPSVIEKMINARFASTVEHHYASSTATRIPLGSALTIASLIEREAGGTHDRRVISGILWNRLFRGMPLQIDATLQYVKASNDNSDGWWPKLSSDDRSRASPYNTYLHGGLPPGPIANPSLDSLLAALNPVTTSCLYYFHDESGHLYCNDTYAEHVSDLKLIFGRGR